MAGVLLDAEIYRCCLAHSHKMRGHDFVVPHSLPIPYFGALADYLASPLRVVTAALNPSGLEFPAADPRFDVAEGLRGPAELEAQLSGYFKRRPYRAWFSAFEPVLNGLGASFGGEMASERHDSTALHLDSTALHLDMCSPIATSPTWSKLTPTQREILTPSGRAIFERLIDALKPDLIVASLGWKHLPAWNGAFDAGPRWERLVVYKDAASGQPLRTPLVVRVNEVQLCMGLPVAFANASAAEKPFGRFTTERKRSVGQALLAWRHGAR